MSFLGSLFGASDEQKRSDALDAKLQKLNNSDYAPGGSIYESTLAKDGKAAADRNWRAVQHDDTVSATQTANIDAQYNEAFQQGAQEGLNAELGAVNKALSGTVNTAGSILSKAIPWQIWALAAVAAFFYFGGLKLLKK